MRDSYGGQIVELKRAEAELVELTPKIKRVEGYVENFPWFKVRFNGVPPIQVSDAMGEMRRCTTLGLNSIRKAIQGIESFNAEDLSTKWRPSRDVGASLANAGRAREQLGFVKRQLEYWGKRLEERLPPIVGGYEATEGEAPIEGGTEIKVLSNYRE